jgi:mono/diheme cytochrome c family protein
VLVAQIPALALMTVLAGALLLGAQLPDGTGKPLVAERCAVCHEPDIVASQRMDRDGWARVLETMIGRGAQLDERERNTVLDYLAKNFGPPPAPSTTDSSVERTARRFIDGICSSCHAADLIAATQATKDGWLEIVQKMNNKGAGMSEADVDLLADYLARTYPPPAK